MVFADPDAHPFRYVLQAAVGRRLVNVFEYIRNGRTCIASIGRFQHEFEPLTKAQAERIAEEIETAEHIKSLRARRAA
ncbi:hypothetical protein [Enterobacter kobei]|uniref:hypothetical protein n=1 Tax=Enterobacter kobei TaxID=208224 RepID=UPI0035ABC7F6